MGLVGETTKQRLDIPHEAGEWMEILPLSWAHLEVARRLKTEDAIKQASLLDAAMLKNIQSVAADNPSAAASAGDGLDKGTVLEHGITAWSYQIEVSAENVRALDEATAMWAFDAIASRSVLSKDEQGNGAAPRSDHI